MGSGASVLSGGQRRLLLQCTDLRMAWCNGLIINSNGEAESIAVHTNEKTQIESDYDNDIEAIDSDEITIDYDYQTERTNEDIERMANEYDRN